MQDKRPESEPPCRCDRTDLRCAALTVRQLSQNRVRELAEEIWARSTGGRPPASHILDPRRSQPGASAFAAYRRYRQLERAAWRPGWGWRAGAAPAACVLIGRSAPGWGGGPRCWWRCSPAGGCGSVPRPRPGLRRRVRMQRRSAGMLAALERDGYLVLHDVTLPGWPASLDHLVVGWTRVWLIRSWRPTWPAALRKVISPRRAPGSSAHLARGAARGGGSSRRRPGRRHQPARSRPAVRPRVAVAGSRLAGLRGPGDDPAPARRRGP
jgi:hypothetical protein